MTTRWDLGRWSVGTSPFRRSIPSRPAASSTLRLLYQSATGAFDLSGTYLDGQLSLLVSGSLTADATALFLGLPIGILITVNGNIVTTPVPEPGSVTLIIVGALCGLVLPIARTASGYTMP